MRTWKSDQKIRLLILIIAMSFMLSTSLLNAGGSEPHQGLTSVFGMFFGTPKAQKMGRNALKGGASGERCDDYGQSSVGMVNTILCRLEKNMGITGVGNYTKTFGTTTIRAEVAQEPTPVILDSVTTTYDYRAKVWVCTGSCTDTSSFSRLFYIAFSKDASGGATKGFLIADYGAFGGDAKSNAMRVQFDLDSNSTTRFVNTISVTKAFKMDGRVTRDSTNLRINMVIDMSGVQQRFAAAKSSADAVDSDFKFYMEMTGISDGSISGMGAIDSAGVIDISDSNTVCVNMKESDDGYASNSAGTCSGLSLNAFAIKASQVASYTMDSVFQVTGSSWNGMGEHPSAL